jgi:predicted ATPase
MITRIEIDGFKSFLDFKLDVPPFLALVGPNSSGKSNLFDAVEFDQQAFGFDEALLNSRRGRPHELFHRVLKGQPVTGFKITISWLVTSAEYTNSVDVHATAWLEAGRPVEHGGTYSYSLPGKQTEEQHEAFYQNVRSAVLGTRHYVPDPPAMRQLASSADVGPLHRNGGNLSAVLGRMQGTESFDHLLVDLTSLVPDVEQIVPELNEKRQEWSFDLVIDGQGSVPSTLLSDGTLRVLGLLAALHDPDHSGTLMIEEIENGLHPSRLAELLRRMRQRVTDIDDPDSRDRPLRQVILTSHSPVVVSELYRMRPDSLVFMDTAVRVDPDRDRVSRVTVAKPVRDDGEPGTFVSPRQVRKYLSAVQPEQP